MLGNLDINDLALLLIVVYYFAAVFLVGYGFMHFIEWLSKWSERWHERVQRRMPPRIANYRR